MSSRPVISYDDITLPYEPSDQPQPQPPPKKRKRNHNNNHPQLKKVQHWDDPDPAATTSAVAAEEVDGVNSDENESRELTHEEIWDDSALIGAWNAAMEEYEAFHGPDKGWKKQPVHQSPLWYNIPPKNQPKKSASAARPRLSSNNINEPDSQPLDFESFVPTHDPGLSGVAEEDEQEAIYTMPLTQFPSNLSQDEAFERAVQASYWSGYWTAVYHYHRQNQTVHDTDTADTEEIQGFVSTQR